VRYAERDKNEGASQVAKTPTRAGFISPATSSRTRRRARRRSPDSGCAARRTTSSAETQWGHERCAEEQGVRRRGGRTWRSRERAFRDLQVRSEMRTGMIGYFKELRYF